MKTKSLIGLVFFLTTVSVSAQEMRTDEFKTYGNCDMCKARIEKAVKSVDGVTSIEWNKDTKMTKVTYDPSMTNLDKIESAIAKAGHDTDAFFARDETYNKLPACCKYERKPKE